MIGSVCGQLKRAFDRRSEPARFLVIGAWNTGFSYALFAVMLWALGPLLQPLAASPNTALRWTGEHWYLVVQWASWALAVPQSTATFKLFVFHSKGHWGAEIVRSSFVYLPLQGFSSLSLWFFVSVVGLHPLVGQLLTVFVAAVASYFGHKYFTFRTPKS